MSKIAVIIVTWNKKEYVLNLLESLENIEKHHLDIDWLVVDNASTDGTMEELNKRYPEVKVIHNQENLGGTGGFNTGLKAVLELGGYDYIWLLDNDVEVAKDTLSQLVNTLDTHPEVGAVGSQMRQLDHPDIINENGGIVSPEGNGLILLNHRMRVDEFNRLPESQGLLKVHYCAAASLLVRFSVVQQVGLWSDFFIHFDDVEWCLRIRGAGHDIVCNPRSVIWHLSADSKPLTWILYYDVRNYLYLLREHYNPNLVRDMIRKYMRMSIKETLKGRVFIANLYLRGVRDFLEGKTGKAEGSLLQGMGAVSWDNVVRDYVDSGTRFLSTPYFGGRPEEALLQRVISLTKNVSLWAAPGDLFGSAFLVGSRLEFWPVNYRKRVLSILHNYARIKKLYDIGVFPYGVPETLVNSMCRRVYMTLDGKLVPLSTNLRSVMFSVARLYFKWLFLKRRLRTLRKTMPNSGGASWKSAVSRPL
ncbi:glycosyltransferase family 2 protein [Alicyclobacillus ferrooxydans]|uniref:glycosyltransferase family 2 protein n=1 Tax=Alicyclobacillus ferrooxydans TaxID=471514 RepID=UPI0006D5777E|nr:glycosyltransferase family 2 protein [Alicyclobacillus ferrooxydans]